MSLSIEGGTIASEPEPVASLGGAAKFIAEAPFWVPGFRANNAVSTEVATLGNPFGWPTTRLPKNRWQNWGMFSGAMVPRWQHWGTLLAEQ